ncbi:Beta-cyclopiazonate dehydrogenase [Lecanosticta acicola]|uniref:Beta-cyclopiazonate dehydrogenase n=1 Tax=Lecanosticta acicola TaxID=111012 RepID=A0AAI9EG65_9PEZI|nr:Beta-cyclopiazonate dehydrogenase [Lecanosticta acicola]
MKTLASLSFCLALAAGLPNVRDQFDPASYSSSNIITRDVAVVGGGSSGTYGAINLKRRCKTVVVIEKQNRLGGPVESYTDAASGNATDYGVQAYWNISLTRDYFGYLGVNYINMSSPLSETISADFRTGQEVQGVGQSSANYSLWEAQLAKYPTLSYSWDLPYPVPSDLLLSFSDFVAKYNLQDEAYDIFQDASGFSSLLQRPTVDVMKIVSEYYLNSAQGNGVVTKDHNNTEIYALALQKLGQDALLSSTVIASSRSASNTSYPIRLVVNTPTGPKLIQAQKLLISIPPILSNLAPLDLDATEISLFSQWTYSNYYAMLINNTGLPSGYRFKNVVADNSTYHIPATPAPYFVSETHIQGLWYVWYTSPSPLTQQAVEADIARTLGRLRKTANSTSSVTPTFVEFKDNSPFTVVPPRDALANGFYEKIKGLQGKRNTWYTGAAWASSESPVLWNFTSNLLPEITA